MRFRPEQHLRRPREIRDVRETGRRYDCPVFTLWWRIRRADSPATASPPSPAPAPARIPRVCVIASTAAVGRAVLRNRAKRRLREVFRRQQHLLPPACDLLLIARRGTTTCPMPELERRFAEACQRLTGAAEPRGAK
jgi:ribonuclease P protein component